MCYIYVEGRFNFMWFDIRAPFHSYAGVYSSPIIIFFLSSFFEKTTVLKSCCRTAKDARILGLLRRIQSGASDEA